MNVYVMSLTKITLQRISKCHLGPQVCRRQTAVVFIPVSSCYDSRVNNTEIVVIEN